MAHRKSHENPLMMLERKYTNCNEEVLQNYLVDLILAERDGNDSSTYLYDSLNPLLGRINRKRIEVAMYYRNKFGNISSLLMKEILPNKDSWPGLVSLFKTRGDEEYFIE